MLNCHHSFHYLETLVIVTGQFKSSKASRQVLDHEETRSFRISFVKQGPTTHLTTVTDKNPNKLHQGWLGNLVDLEQVFFFVFLNVSWLNTRKKCIKFSPTC
jgi:hypothetical protein